MDTFWKLLEQSTITSGFIAGCMIVTGCYCVICNIILPEWFSLALNMIIGFFFSDKVASARISNARKAE